MSEKDLDQLSITELADRQGSGALTARASAALCLERIEQLDCKVNALLELNPDIEAIADQLDRERAEGQLRGPLHGIPIVIKGNIDTADGMTTTAGSLALEGSIAARDAGVVAALRQAGAVILGKTNLSEWANFRSRRSSSGWSSLGGQTRNPHALDRTPGGSSSGSAVAVAAGFCPGAIGTETDGSIVSPSALNGIVGIKPTLGLIHGEGIIPIAHSQDTAGPMARNVADAALLLDAISLPGRAAESFAEGLSPAGLKGARIGVARSYCGFDQAVDQVFETALAALRESGAEVIDEVPLVTPEILREDEYTVMLYEFKAGLNAYLAQLGPTAPVRSLSEVIAFNERHSDRVMPYFPQDILVLAEAKGPLTERRYLSALVAVKQLAGERGIDAALNGRQLDAIVAPTICTPWLIDWVNGDNRSGGSACTAAVAGYPSVTVPAGQIRGLPVGISFFASAFQERRLVQLAYAFEQTTQAHRTPNFPDSIVF